MGAHLSRVRLVQRHLRSLVWAWVWVWDWIHSHTPPRTRSPCSRHPPFTHHPFPPRSLVCGGQTSPHKSRLVVSHSTCPLLSSSPHAHSFVLGTAVINTHTPWSFGFDSQTRGTKENRVPPCVKVPGSSRVPFSPHRLRLIVSRSTYPPLSPPPPHANSFVIDTAVINNTCANLSRGIHILPIAEEQSRTRGGQSGGVEG
jgi:hypothetical protein